MLAISGAQASDARTRDLRGVEKQAFFNSQGWQWKLKCTFVRVAVSNERWAMVTPNSKCGPNSGHSAVYRHLSNGKWKYLFYDGDNGGCSRFRMPESVRRDFSPYVC